MVYQYPYSWSKYFIVLPIKKFLCSSVLIHSSFEIISSCSFSPLLIPIYSKAAGIIALDTPYFAYKDQKGLITDCQNAKRLGFEGKFAIHPEQIDTINQNFSPTKQEFDQAVREIQVYEESENLGRGSTSLEYQVIDVPVVERARKLVRRYKTITGDEG